MQKYRGDLQSLALNKATIPVSLLMSTSGGWVAIDLSDSFLTVEDAEIIAVLLSVRIPLLLIFCVCVRVFMSFCCCCVCVSREEAVCSRST